MTEQPFRNPSGGAIDRTRPLDFLFNGRGYQGYAGDTLASALLANGVSLVSRSFKYHRPRGLFGLGAEEPNGLVEVGQGARREPNTPAPRITRRVSGVWVSLISVPCTVITIRACVI